MSWLPSPEYADWWYDLSWKGIIGFGAIAAVATSLVVVFTMLQFWSDAIRDRKSDERNRTMEVQLGEANARTKEAELKLEELRRKTSPRSITQEQQNELAARLSQFKGVRGTMVASPSTPETEMFTRWLGAPLHDAGWDITFLPGSPAATILFPTGVIVQYPWELGPSVKIGPDGKSTVPEGPWGPLVNALNEFGIDATAIPEPMQPPNNIAIVVNVK